MLTTASPQVVQGVKTWPFIVSQHSRFFSAMNNSDHILKPTLEYNGLCNVKEMSNKKVHQINPVVYNYEKIMEKYNCYTLFLRWI